MIYSVSEEMNIHLHSGFNDGIFINKLIALIGEDNQTTILKPIAYAISRRIQAFTFQPIMLKYTRKNGFGKLFLPLDAYRGLRLI